MKRTLFLLAVLFSLGLTSCKNVEAKDSTDAAVDTTAVDTTKVDSTEVDTTAVKVDTTKA
jgi:PBP1b-binding outer membrane lipoprotein LpoB